MSNRRHNSRQRNRGIPPTSPIANSLKAPAHDRDINKVLNKRLKSKSTWYQSIVNPAQGGGAKLPDDVGLETGTLQMVLESSMVTNTANFAGFRTTTLYPNKISTVGENYHTIDAASTPTTIAWGPTQPFPTNASLAQFSVGVRIVSAVMYAQPETSLADAAGEIVAGFIPWGITTSPLLDDYRIRYGASIIPLNNNRAVKTIWTPVSRDLDTYASFFDPLHSGYGYGPGDCPYWCFYAFVDGATRPGLSVRIKIIVNYEFIPHYNSIDIISANPSPVDEVEQGMVEGWVSQLSATGLATMKEITDNPGTSAVDKAEESQTNSGFGMAFEFIKESIPFIMDMAEFAL
jgi:hypothetical protein